MLNILHYWRRERSMGLPGKTIGQCLEMARNHYGFSRAKVAEMIGSSPNSIANWEKAGTPEGKYPPLPKLVRLCKLYEIDPRELFDLHAWYEDESDFFYVNDGEDDDVPYDPGYFSFVDFFASNLDFLNWQLSVKDIEDVNFNFQMLTWQYDRIEAQLEALVTGKKKRPDFFKKPSRSERTTDDQAVGAASKEPQKPEDQ